MTTSAPGKGTSRYIAPISPKAPRIAVTESNRTVETQVEAAGGITIRPSYTASEAVRDLASCDGLLITGGGDVNPALYGQDRDKSVYGLTTSRDLRELALLGAARDLGIPVLGICRGLQIINVEAGGTLYQNIPDRLHSDRHACDVLPVRTVRGSLVHRTLGDNPEMLHLHHQAVRRLAKGFQVTARHADGTVEAIESFDGRVVGVQFHPESVLTTKGSTAHTGWRLFDAFVATCTRYRRRVRAQGRVTITDPSKYVNAWPVAVEAHARGFSSYGKGGWRHWSDDDTAIGTGSTVHGQGAKSGPKASNATGNLVLVKGSVDGHENGIAEWCTSCGIAFDDLRDWADHMEFVHAVDFISS